MPSSKLPVPVTLLSGFLGSGKTTLLKHILETREPGLKVAVLVNDMAELNIDATLIKQTQFLQKEERMVEMHNGCICCTLREDLLVELSRLVLASDDPPQAILIESTGVSEPQQVAETFTFPLEVTDEDDLEDEPTVEDEVQRKKRREALSALGERLAEAGQRLGSMPESLDDIAKLDTCVTVIDCQAFSGDLTSCGTLLERYRDRGGVEDEDDRNIAQLFIDQIEFANVILLNKIDLVRAPELQSIRRLVQVLNPGARVIETDHARVPVKQILQTGLFDMAEAERSSGWLKSLREETKPETEEYGIGSFVYRARTPFHPQRLHRFLERIFLLELVNYDDEIALAESNQSDLETPGEASPKRQPQVEEEGEEEDEAQAVAKRNEIFGKCQTHMKAHFGEIYRSKGFLWIAGRDGQFCEWSQAGAIGELSCGDPWLGVMPEQVLPEEGSEERKLMEKDFQDELIQDRRQEIVFIGKDLKKEAISQGLAECLLKPEDNPKSTTPGDQGWKFGWQPQDPSDDLLPKWPNVEGQLADIIEQASDILDENEADDGEDNPEKEPKIKKQKKE